MSTIQVAQSGVSRQLRHVKRTHGINTNWLSALLRAGTFNIFHVPSHLQAADVFIKAFTNKANFTQALEMIGVGESFKKEFEEGI